MHIMHIMLIMLPGCLQLPPPLVFLQQRDISCRQCLAKAVSCHMMLDLLAIYTLVSKVLTVLCIEHSIRYMMSLICVGTSSVHFMGYGFITLGRKRSALLDRVTWHNNAQNIHVVYIKHTLCIKIQIMNNFANNFCKN